MEDKLDEQFKNLDIKKMMDILCKLAGNSNNCEYTYTLIPKKKKGTAPTVPNKN